MANLEKPGTNAVSYASILPRAEMARTEGTVDTVGRSRNQIWVPNPVPNAGNKKEKSITRRYAVER
jgi:hypothetical protein